MFRKIFASLVFAGAIALALSLCFAAGANADGYIVKKDDCLWSISRRATGHGINYLVIVDHNFPADREPRRSPHLIFPGESIWIPYSWAVALGIVSASEDVEPGQVPLLVDAKIMAPTARESIWPVIGALGLLLLAGVIVAFWRPWNFFRPDRGGRPMVPGGVQNATEAAEVIYQQVAEELQQDSKRAATIPQPFSIMRLWEVKLYGLLEVKYADGRVERRMASGQMAYLAELSDGSQHIILQRCGNDVRMYGRSNRLLDGRYEIVREIELWWRSSRDEILAIFEPKQVPVVTVSPAPMPALSPERPVGPPNRQRVQFVKAGRWQSRLVYRP